MVLPTFPPARLRSKRMANEGFHMLSGLVCGPGRIFASLSFSCHPFDQVSSFASSIGLRSRIHAAPTERDMRMILTRKTDRYAPRSAAYPVNHVTRAELSAPTLPAKPATVPATCRGTLSMTAPL